MTFETICLKGVEFEIPCIFLPYVSDAVGQGIVDWNRVTSTNRDSSHYSELLNGIDISGKSIVDICSGTGNLDDLASEAGMICRIDSEYWKGIQQISTECPEKIEFQNGDAYTLPLTNGVADIITETHGVTYHNPILRKFRTLGKPFAQAVHDSRTKLGGIGGEIITYFHGILEKLRVVKEGGIIVMGPVAGEDQRLTYVYETLLKPTLKRWEEARLVEWNSFEVTTQTCVFGRTYCQIRVLGQIGS